MTASAEYNAIAVTQLRLCRLTISGTLVTQFEKAEQNMRVTESGRISDAVNQGSSLWLAQRGILSLGENTRNCILFRAAPEHTTMENEF